MLAVPLAAVSGWLTLGGVFIALALISALSAIFEMADHAFLPSLIDASQLVDGNAKLGTTDAVAEFGGPALAGVLVQVLTAPIAVGATAATYLASALCLTSVRTPEMHGEAPEAERPAAAPADFDVLRGVRAVLDTIGAEIDRANFPVLDSEQPDEVVSCSLRIRDHGARRGDGQTLPSQRITLPEVKRGAHVQRCTLQLSRPCCVVPAVR